MSFKIAKQNVRQTLYNTSYSPLIHSSYVLRRHVPHMLHTFPPLTSPPSSVASSPPRPRGPFYPAGSSDTRPAAPAIPPRIRIQLGVQAALADWALKRQQLIQHRANTTLGSDATNRLGNDPWRLVQLCLAMYVRVLPSAASQQNGGKSVRGKIMHGRAVGVTRKIQLLEKFASKTGLVVPRRVLICDESHRIPTSHLARASLPFPASLFPKRRESCGQSARILGANTLPRPYTSPNAARPLAFAFLPPQKAREKSSGCRSQRGKGAICEGQEKGPSRGQVQRPRDEGGISRARLRPCVIAVLFSRDKTRTNFRDATPARSGETHGQSSVRGSV